jgi:hypothetical protein
VNVEAQYQGGSTRRKTYILARSATLFNKLVATTLKTVLPATKLEEFGVDKRTQGNKSRK